MLPIAVAESEKWPIRAKSQDITPTVEITHSFVGKWLRLANDGCCFRRTNWNNQKQSDKNHSDAFKKYLG